MIGIVHVMARMAPGGTEHQLLGMLEAAVTSGLWDPTLCVLSDGHPLTERARQAGIRTIEIEGGSRADPGRLAPFRHLTAPADLIHSSLWGANAFSRIANLGSGRPPVVISERGVEDHRTRAQRLVDRTLAPLTMGFIGNSRAVTEFISGWHGIDPNDDRLAEIGNGIDTDIFHPRRRADGAGFVNVITSVGRLIPGKRVDRLIAMLPAVLEHVPAELVVAGDGPEREKLTAMASGLPVRFLGHVGSREQLAGVLRSTQVLAMPSASEGLPNAVIEALACGSRVVASDIPGIRPLAGPGVTLVEDDPGAWVAALVSAIEAGPPDTSVPHWSVRSFEQVAKEHLAHFEQAIERHRNRKGEDRE
jgi:glycosyltransferase involved in cell wall biosynthesis